MFAIKWDGLEELNNAFDKLEIEVLQAVKEGVVDCTEDLAKVSSQLSPLLEGDLQASPTVDIKINGSNITGEVSYNSPYALRRHEEEYKPGTRKEYDKSGRPVGYIIDGKGPLTRSKPSVDGMIPGRKYLEQPLKKYGKDKYMKYIANKVKGALR